MSGTANNEVINDKEQHSYFSPAFQFLLYLIVFSFVMGCLTSVFNFYNFDYSQYYSIIFFYLFLMSCTFILPVRMIGVDPPNYTHNLQQLATLIMTKEKKTQEELEGQD